jgi:hypothetical protein
VYVDPIQRRARWKLVEVGARKKLSNGRRAAKLARRRSVETAKKLKKQIKVIQQNTKQKPGWRRQEMRKRDGGIGSRDIK